MRKTFATADAAGEVWVRHSTSEQTLLKLSHDGAGGMLRALELSPREDGVLAVDGRGGAAFWRISAPHPETTMRSLFGRVWYEGYPEPSYTWQSSSGTDSFEPKLSLVPLIFGTIKATLYAMLFAVPVALLAAIYTSEFVHPSVRATVKPVMEMMASLPSVVLGFIAALILAPIVETWIAAVLMAFVALPLALLVSAYLWQLVPQTIALRLQGAPKLALMFVVLALAFYLCYAAGGIFEDVFFAGDVKAWANGDVGSGAPFLFLVLLPIAASAVAMAARRFLGDSANYPVEAAYYRRLRDTGQVLWRSDPERFAGPVIEVRALPEDLSTGAERDSIFDHYAPDSVGTYRLALWCMDFSTLFGRTGDFVRAEEWSRRGLPIVPAPPRRDGELPGMGGPEP